LNDNWHWLFKSSEDNGTLIRIQLDRIQTS
jgi:hypothetical protein